MVLGSICLNHGVKLADEIGRVRFNAGLVRLMLSCNRGAPGVCRLEWCQDDDMGPAASCSSGIKSGRFPASRMKTATGGSLSQSLFQPPSRDWGGLETVCFHVQQKISKMIHYWGRYAGLLCLPVTLPLVPTKCSNKIQTPTPCIWYLSPTQFFCKDITKTPEQDTHFFAVVPKPVNPMAAIISSSSCSPSILTSSP